VGASSAACRLAVRIYLSRRLFCDKDNKARYNPHPDAAFIPNLLRHVYESPLEDLCNRRLALTFIIVAVGHVVDVAQPCNRIAADRFYQLARASLSEVSVLESVNTDAILVLVCLLLMHIEMLLTARNSSFT
jgi:hypothetical protein